MMFTGEIAAVGPTSFEFCVPEGAPLMVSPAVGTVLPGQVSKCLVIIAALVQYTIVYFWGQAAVGAKLQATNLVPRPVDRGTATRYGG